MLAILVWTILVTQAWLPLNPNGAPNMSWDLALHTMVSFLTNTNQQHYSGQAQLSFLAHMVGIVGLQVITPMMGLALVVATLRGLFGARNPQGHKAETNTPAEVDVGNYWADLIRPTLRFMLPLALVWSVMLTSQGVPATLASGPVVAPVDATAEYMRRLRDKGARMVRPADFPSLVPSSPAGHVSIYLGLRGPSLVVADLVASGECALMQAHELISAGEVDRLCVGAVEERSKIVEEVLSIVFADALGPLAPPWYTVTRPSCGPKSGSSR